jgi:predicted dehydrogenase
MRRMPAPDGTLRLAIIGTGRWASSLALEIVQTPFVALVACWDTDATARETFAVEFGVPAAPSFEALLGDPSIDAGVACVPNAAHRTVALALAAAGKHVFVPRPIANYVAAARDMIKAASDGGVVLFVDHTSSFSPAVEAMYAEVSSGRVGRLIGGHALRSADWAHETGGADWHQSPRECPGGPATLLGVPAAATLIRFLGTPTGVHAALTSGIVPSRIPNVATFLVEHESGAHSTLVASGVSAVPSDHVYFYGTDGMILSGPTVAHAAPCAVVAEAQAPAVAELSPRGARVSGIAMFAEQIRTGRVPDCSTRLALTALATVEAGLRSVSENRRIAITELTG